MSTGIRHLIARMSVDRDAEVDTEGLTLGILSGNIARAIAAGVPETAKVGFDYLPRYLTEALFVEEAIDLTKASFDDLRIRTRTNDESVSVPAWAEIKRRVEAFGLTGDHDV